MTQHEGRSAAALGGDDTGGARRPADTPAFDLVIVGAGFAGLYMLHRARGLGLRAVVLEAGAGVGGTWYWNRYPGARCDVESMEYSYSFSDELQQQWRWSERFATQPEILRYANHVAERFGLLADIRFGARVVAARWDESRHGWSVGTEDGQTLNSRFLVMATGCLSSLNRPAIPGLDDFAGDRLFTGQWPHEPVDFTGRRVGLIGTGSSAIQSIPLIAAQAAHLTVFQRTPNYSVPARNAPLTEQYERSIKSDYAAFRARNARMPAAFGSAMPRNEASVFSVDEDTRRQAFETRWQRGGLVLLGAFGDLMVDAQANRVAADFVRAKIRGIVRDPDVAERLSPRQTIGCKRLCVDTGYYETFNRPNVTLVDIAASPIERITPDGLVTGAGQHRFDTLVLATGFDAMTGSLLRIDIRGVGDRRLADAWADGPRTYLGLGIAGFPNLFTISGPGSPSVLTNMLVSIEQHVDWISGCLAHLGRLGLTRIEADAAAARAWVEHVNSVADATLYPTCNSWYLGANVPGKTRVFMPLIGFPAYVDRCNQVAAEGYPGFLLSAAA